LQIAAWLIPMSPTHIYSCIKIDMVEQRSKQAMLADVLVAAIHID